MYVKNLIQTEFEFQLTLDRLSIHKQILLTRVRMNMHVIAKIGVPL